MGNEGTPPTPEATLPFGASFDDITKANRDAAALGNTGTQEANRDFVERSGFDIETLGAFGATSVGLSQSQQDEIADRKNWIGRTFSAGSKWGVLGAPWEGAPAWLRVPNPLKTLGAWTDHVILPAWGGAVGFASVGLSKVPANTREKLAPKFGTGPNLGPEASFLEKASHFTDLTGSILKMAGGAINQTLVKADSVAEVWKDTQFDGSLAQRWQQLEDYNLERPELFIGEKLFGSLVADPMSYLGFGLFGKIPVIGRVNLSAKGRKVNVGIGGLESGFLNTVDFPFKLAATGYKKFIPKARKATATQTAVRAQAAFDVTVERNIGRAVRDITNPDDIAKSLAETVDLIVPDELVAPSTRELRDHLFTRPDPQGVELSSMSRLVGLSEAGSNKTYKLGAEVGEELNRIIRNPNELRSDISYGRPHDIGETLNLAVRGRMNVEAASDRLIGLLGGVAGPQSSENMQAYIRAQIKTTHEEIRRMVTKGDILEIRARVAARSHNVAEANLNRVPLNIPRKVTIGGVDIGIADAMHMQGRIAGILQRIDYTAYKYQQAWYGQKGAKTFAGWVLMFPGFTPGNILEETGRTLGMGLKAGSADAIRMGRRLQGLDHDFHQLIDPVVKGASKVNRVQAMRQTPEGVFDVLRQAGASDSWIQRHGEKLKWMNPKTFRDASVEPAMKIRQHGVIELWNRAVTDDIVSNEHWIAEMFKEIPEGVSNDLREVMIEEMIAVSAQGPDVIRNAVNIIASHKLNENKIMTAVHKILGDGSFSPDVTDSFIRWGSNPSRRLSEIPEMIGRAKAQAFNDMVEGPEGIRIALDHAVSVLDDITDPQELYAALTEINQLTGDLTRNIRNVVHTAANRYSAINISEASMQVRMADARRTIGEIIDNIETRQRHMVQVMKDKEVAVFGSNMGYAEAFNSELGVATKFWKMDRDAVEDYFKVEINPSAAYQGVTFREGYAKLRESIWDGPGGFEDTMEEVLIKKQVAQEAMQSHMQTNGTSRIMKNIDKNSRGKDYSGRDLTLQDAAFIVGSTAEGVSQSLLRSAFMPREDFIRHMVKKGEAYGMIGVTEKKAAKIYDQIMNSAGITGRRADAFAPIERRLDELQREMNLAVIPEYSNDELRLAQEWGNSIADRIGGITRLETDQARMTGFMDEWNKKFHTNRYGNGWVIDDVVFDIENRADHIYISEVRALNPGKGQGTKALNQVTELADEFGIELRLNAGSLRGSQTLIEPQALQRFYKKSGFEFPREAFPIEESTALFQKVRRELEDFVIDPQTGGFTDESARFGLNEIDQILGQDVRDDLMAEILRRELFTPEDLISAADEVAVIPQSVVRDITKELDDALMVLDEVDWDKVDALFAKLPRQDRIKALDEMFDITKGERDRNIARITGTEPDSVTEDLVKQAFSAEDVQDIAQDQIRGTQMQMNELQRRIDDLTKEIAVDTNIIDSGLNARTVDQIGLDELYNTLTNTVRADFGDAGGSLLDVGKRVSGTQEVIQIDPAKTAATAQRLERHNKLIKGVRKDFDLNYVNYDDETIVESIASNVFPFARYEMARLPYMLRMGVSRPAWNSFFMPEGRYMEATDEGYIPLPFVPWGQFNPFGGSVYNTPRRMFRAEFSPQDQTGFIGKYSEYQSKGEHLGFYGGVHSTVLVNGIFPLFSGNKPTLGEALPPPATGMLAALEWSGIAGVSDITRFIRNTVFFDTFREHQIAKTLTERGLNPAEINWTKFEPIKEAVNLTQEDMDKASQDSAMMEFAQEMSGMMRFRGPKEEELRKANDDLTKATFGVAQGELDSMRINGISPHQVLPLPNTARRQVAEMHGSDEFGYARSRLHRGDRRRITELTQKMYADQDKLYEALEEEMFSVQNKWLSGEFDRKAFVGLMRSNRVELIDTKNNNRGRRRNRITGELEVFNEDALYAEVPVTYADFVELQNKYGDEFIPIRHVFDELLEEWYNIVPVDANNDGQFEMNDFYDQRDAFMERLPDEFHDILVEELDNKTIPAERILRQAIRGDIGEYWDIERKVAEEFGQEMIDLRRDVEVATINNPDQVALLRKNPLWGTFTRQVNREKEIMRLTNPKMEYTLYAFGYLNTFLSGDAADWWREDGNHPVLARME